MGASRPLVSYQVGILTQDDSLMAFQNERQKKCRLLQGCKQDIKKICICHMFKNIYFSNKKKLTVEYLEITKNYL